MGLLADVFDKITQVAHGESSYVIFSIALLVALLSSVLWHIGRQLFFKAKHEPPEVFSWLPFIGHTISYGMDPPNFFAAQRKKVRESMKALLTV
jgi:sterol 14-demethylase